ncbi:M20/M25/M40 family metallo-hydrolase [Marinicauda algicola]|uniref:M20/M25/M40 family metallo-hydrolase n=1 Tax=Marinicauda algicola TaxID=2029849 RepID=A0A4S2GYV6_9PROT|nr:M20/M25/M40 family metallo-hydrolase [Marinicauda algicola]TGY88316.1 M20/M25/M40 family metallo-hydrolase [Marinicauda algicola]
MLRKFALPVLLVLTAACAREPELAQPLEDLRTLAADDMEGREVGTPGNARARAYIVERFSEIGLTPVNGSFEHAFDFSRPVDFRDPQGERRTLAGVNVLGLVEGEDRSRVMVVSAHYDHVGYGEGEIFNGADDNASGVAALLAIAEHFMAHPPEHDVLFAAFDAEEGGLNGARHFVANRPELPGEIAFNLNLDMVGYSPDGDLYAVGTWHYPVLVPLVEHVADGAPVRLLTGYDRPTDNPRDDWTLLSDHAPFHMAGIPFLYLGVEDHEHYHQVSDEYEIITRDFFLGAVETAVRMAEEVDADLDAIAGAVSGPEN